MNKLHGWLIATAVLATATATGCASPALSQPTEPTLPAPSAETLPPATTEPLDLPDPVPPSDVPAEPPATEPASTEPRLAPPTAAPPTAAPPSPPASPRPSDAETPTTSEDPVATRQGSVARLLGKAIRVRGSLYPVQRTGDTATVNLLIVSDDPNQAFALGNALGDGNPETSSKSRASVDGIRLIDPVAKKAHLAATTADGTCLCTPTDGSGVFESQSVVWVSVVFAAPPASTTTVDVVLPIFGTVNDVPVL